MDKNKNVQRHDDPLKSWQNQTIELRDLFAIAALVGEFASHRGATVEQAVSFSYAVADQMLKARGAGK